MPPIFAHMGPVALYLSNRSPICLLFILFTEVEIFKIYLLRYAKLQDFDQSKLPKTPFSAFSELDDFLARSLYSTSIAFSYAFLISSSLKSDTSRFSHGLMYLRVVLLQRCSICGVSQLPSSVQFGGL